MPDKRLVRAVGDLMVPMAENPRRYITTEPVTIDLQGQFGAYYARRLMQGELEEVSLEVHAEPKKAAAPSIPAPAPHAGPETIKGLPVKGKE
jgi:hypothetical protein